jgi:hypothetical protein
VTRIAQDSEELFCVMGALSSVRVPWVECTFCPNPFAASHILDGGLSRARTRGAHREGCSCTHTRTVHHVAGGTSSANRNLFEHALLQVPLTRAWVGNGAVEAVVTCGQIQGEPSATIGVNPLEAPHGPE